VALGFALSALAACGAPVESAGPADGAAVVHPRWTSCAEEAPVGADLLPDASAAADLPPLAADFVAVAAIVCRKGPEQRPGGGTDLLATESRADDVAALVDALRLPTEPRAGGACTLDLPFVDWFALLDAQGRWVRPGVPTDGCGKPRIEVREALRALTLKRLDTRVLREIESSAAASSGCGQRWADMVWVETSQGAATPGSIGPNLFTPQAQVRLCTYRVPDSEKGGGKPAGEFERGGVLPAPRWADIAAELRAAGPAPACATPAGRFALLRAVDSVGGEIYVELDGCRRIMLVTYPGRPALAAASQTLIGLLDKA
jgi:hypothetical protein